MQTLKKLLAMNNILPYRINLSIKMLQHTPINPIPLLKERWITSQKAMYTMLLIILCYMLQIHARKCECAEMRI